MQSKYVYNRFILIILPVCIAAFITTIAIFEWANFISSKQYLNDRMNELSATYSLLYAEPVAMNDTDKIRLLTISLITDPDIVSVTIKEIAGKVVDEYGALSDADSHLVSDSTIVFADQESFQQVGMLTLGLSTKRIYSDLHRRIRAEALLLLILIIAVLTSVAIAFKRAVGEPLQQLSYQASHDSLTGLFNRQAFEENLLQHGNNDITQSHLLMLDLDDFKIINDTCGHAAGDDALKKVTAILLLHLRNNDIIARLGGDEFGILLHDYSLENALIVSNKIRKEIENFIFKKDGHSFNMSVSIGVLALTDGTHSPSEQLVLADKACYQAKGNGRNRVCLYSPLS